MDGITLTPLKQILHPKGDIFHVMKKNDDGYCGFGEAYFTNINHGEIKGWNRHNEMTLNLVVVCGEVEFIIHNEYNFFSAKLSKNNYQRLTIKPNLWLAFRGLDSENIVLNLANIEHKSNESDKRAIESFEYNWKK